MSHKLQMPEASNVYSNMDGGHEFDPDGVVGCMAITFSKNLVSLRDIENIGIEV